MGVGDLLAEIESGGSTRYPRDEEDLTYKKPVANLAAKEKAEKYNRYYYATGPISCGGRSKPTPVYYPPNWVYAPGDTPRPSLDKETILWTSSSSSNHDQENDVIPQIDTVNEAVAAVEPTTNKAVHTKANEADDHINSDQDATPPFDGMDVDSLIADTITPSSRRAKALKKTRGAGSSPKIPSSKPSSPVPKPGVLFPITAQPKVTPLASINPQTKRKLELLDRRGLKRARIELKERKDLLTHSLNDGAATLEAQKRAAAVPDTPTKYFQMNLEVKQVQCQRCMKTFDSQGERTVDENTCVWHSGMFATSRFVRCSAHGDPEIEEGDSKYSCCGSGSPEHPGCETALGHIFD